MDQNQPAGYREKDIKVAVYMGYNKLNLRSFRLVEVTSGKTVLEKNEMIKSEPLTPLKVLPAAIYRILRGGIYRIEAGKCCLT